MVSNQQETEVKIYVRNLAELQQHLRTIGAELVQERVFERNIRYDDQYDTLTDKGVVLRLRHDIITRLTYKAPGIIERGIMTREELEVEVSNFDTMEQIIFRLGYSPAMMYEKYRTTYQVGETEVMLDELPYGNFIEI